jgi:hypothetical protein
MYNVVCRFYHLEAARAFITLFSRLIKSGKPSVCAADIENLFACKNLKHTWNVELNVKLYVQLPNQPNQIDDNAICPWPRKIPLQDVCVPKIVADRASPV